MKICSNVTKIESNGIRGKFRSVPCATLLSHHESCLTQFDRKSFWTVHYAQIALYAQLHDISRCSTNFRPFSSLTQALLYLRAVMQLSDGAQLIRKFVAIRNSLFFFIPFTDSIRSLTMNARCPFLFWQWNCHTQKNFKPSKCSSSKAIWLESFKNKNFFSV